MEIIHVVLGKANPGRMNGVNRVVNELASRQALAGETVSLWGITSSPEHDYPARPYHTRLFKAGKSPFKLAKGMLTALDEKRPGEKGPGTIFHLHGGFIPSFNKLAIALHERKIPFVFTPHGSYNTIALEKSKWRKKLYMLLYERKLLSYAKAIHCIGKSEVSGLENLYPCHKSVLIPYGFSSSGPAPRKLDPRRFIIGFCGRIDIYTKGLDLLLEAFSSFVKQVPRAELWIIGDSAERLDLQDMAEDLGIQGNITFFGSRYDGDKLDLLMRMHAFVHPSRNEGLPTAVLEASSLGVPCIVTEATNMGDSIRQFQCGEVILHADAGELLGAMRALYLCIADFGMDTLSVNARRMVLEGYDWDKILPHFHRLYAAS